MPGSLRLPKGEQVSCLLSGKLSQQLRAESAAQFCPDCLREAPYHRLIWLPMAVSACCQHQGVLVDQCPACRQSLTIGDIVATRCKKCGASLKETQGIGIGQDPVGLLSQQVIQSWLMGGPRLDQHLSPALPDQPPAVLYSLLHGLRFSITQVTRLRRADSVRPVPQNWRSLHDILGILLRRPVPGHLTSQNSTSEQSYYLFATAFQSLLNWPDGFHRFLRAYCGRDGREDAYGVYLALSELYEQWFDKCWRHPAFQFVREAFDEYLLEQSAASAIAVHTRWRCGQPARADRFAYATMAEAAQLLKTSLPMVERLADIGRLQWCKPQEPFGQRSPFVLRIEVLRLRRQWEEPLSLNQAAWWLGLAIDVTLDLAQAGLLTSECRSGLNGSMHWLIHKQSVVDLWSAVMAKANLTLHALPEMVTLGTATQRLKAIGLDAAGLVERAAAGNLHAYRPIPVSSELDAVVLSQRDIHAYVRNTRRKNKRTKHEDESLGRQVTDGRSPSSDRGHRRQRS